MDANSETTLIEGPAGSTDKNVTEKDVLSYEVGLEDSSSNTSAKPESRKEKNSAGAKSKEIKTSSEVERSSPRCLPKTAPTKESSKKQTKIKGASNAKAVAKCAMSEREEESAEVHERRIPSKEKCVPWIRASSSTEWKTDPRYEGKWMIFSDCQSKNKDGLTKHDVLWLRIEQMVTKRELYKAHASTSCPSAKPPRDAGHGSGTICCFTRDYRDKDDVKLSAEKIRAKLGPEFNGLMLYKTNEAKDSDGLALYRYLAGGSFWERDEKDDKWLLVSSN